MLQCAIIGFGGLGKAHFNGMGELSDIAELVAICDIDASQFEKVVATNLGDGKGALDLSKYRLYTDAEEMLEKEELDVVITALPTYLHEKYAVMALDKGCHVFSEKPMARSLLECKSMVEAAKRNQRLLSIGQCMRFDSEYLELKRFVDTGIYGKLMRLEMTRYSYAPIWGWENWFMDYEKSGGAALDLHVHDVDFINFILGRPEAVFSRATHKTCRFDCISTQYIYPDGAIVQAVGDWSLNEAYGFRPAFFAAFEKAVCTRTNEEGLIIYPEGGKSFRFEPDGSNKYVNEVRYFMQCILENKENSMISPESAMQSIEIALAEIKSAETNAVVKL